MKSDRMVSDYLYEILGLTGKILIIQEDGIMTGIDCCRFPINILIFSKHSET